MHRIEAIDSHTGGEPTRVIVSGFPGLGAGELRARRQLCRDRHDHWRRAVVCEPRGADPLVGALLLSPVHADACASVLFFNNVGYLGMCGHGAIGVAHTLAFLGRIGPGRHRLDTVVGPVEVALADDHRVTIHNVESWRLAANISVEVPGYGAVRGDIAWGGNWFFITADTPVALIATQWRELTRYTEAVRRALAARGITGAGGAEIDHIEVSGASSTPGVDGRNFVLCPGLVHDRSPCGTGTSAKLACLAAEGKLAPGVTWRQEGISGSVFEASYSPAAHGIIPHITGRAHITAQATLLIDPDDPFAWGLAEPPGHPVVQVPVSLQPFANLRQPS
jgi:proline racemase